MRHTHDIAIIGAGSAGLVGADFAMRLGARVALIERDRIGGDCTWTGCVPSKALIRAARAARDMRTASRFGIDAGPVRVDMTRVRDHVRRSIATLYEHEDPDTLSARGIDVILAPAEFIDADTIRAGDRTLRPRRVVICTGARAAEPEIAGLDHVPHFTYERVFDNDRLPERLVVVGGGPLGLEVAQAYRGLGAEVTVVAPVLLAREEPEVQAFVRAMLETDGVRIVSGRATAAAREGDAIRIDTTAGAARGDMLLVAAGRTPAVRGLRLENAGVEHDERGIRVDRWLRTSARHIYAAGDVVAGSPRFTHVAAWQCFRAVRNALLPWRSAAELEALPWVTFLEPEVARVGMSEEQAGRAHPGRVRVHRHDLAASDRPVCDGEVQGFIRIIAHADGRVLGASIVAARAGEMIGELGLAIAHGIPLGDIAGTLHAFPTWTTPVQQLASSASIERFLRSTTGRLARWLARLNR